MVHPLLERPSEAQRIAVGIGDMEEALAPFRVARRLDPVAGGDQSCIQPVYIRVVEDHAACRGSAATMLEPRKTIALAVFTELWTVA